MQQNARNGQKYELTIPNTIWGDPVMLISNRAYSEAL